MNAGLIVGLALGGMLLISIPMFIFVYHAAKIKAKEKQDKLELKLAHELENKKVDFQIEKERAEITPRFCRYCGAKHGAKDKNCSVCVAVI